MSKTIEQQFFETLDEKQKRLYAGLRANERGYFGVRQVSEELGLHPHTIRAGQKDLVALSQGAEILRRVRKAGGGRKKTLPLKRS